MASPHDLTDQITACTDQAAALTRAVTAALDQPGTPGADPAHRGEHVAALDTATEQLRWCRDAVTVLARRAGATWHGLETSTGIADATLSARARRFTDREHR